MSSQMERVTVYLTPENKARLSNLQRGEKAKTLNEALNAAFMTQARQNAFTDLMAEVDAIEPVTPVMPTTQLLELIRSGREDEISDISQAS